MNELKRVVDNYLIDLMEGEGAEGAALIRKRFEELEGTVRGLQKRLEEVCGGENPNSREAKVLAESEVAEEFFGGD